MLLVAVVLAAVAAAGLVRVAVVASQRASAQAAADAAALAGAADGIDAARRVAKSNRARLVSYATTGDEVEVTVERDGVRATATARWFPHAVTGIPERRRGESG